MKKKLSVNEFKRYCEENKFNSITYTSDNQTWYSVSDPCGIDMCFSVMLINENPNIVCLKSGVNILQFDLVKFAEVDTESSAVGTVISIHCGYHLSKDKIVYTLMAK